MKGFLFDLDGTLVDTAVDMLAALKMLAAENNIFIEPEYEQYKELITHGSRAIVESIFPKPDKATFLALQKRYLEIYQDILTQGSCVFEGVDQVIEYLDTNNIPWGIVTNKPSYLATPLVESLPQLKNCQVLIGGDTTNHSKPHPEPINQAIKALNLNPKNSWYIGDAQSDISAGSAAGMKTAVALWGYIGANDKPHLWQADVMLKEVHEMLSL